jgi:serine/threonine protein phosphatase PrpC
VPTSASDAAEQRLFEVSSRTHPGCVRELNEDCCVTFCLADSAGLLVADGVSGENGGDTASRTAIEVAFEALRSEEDSLRPERRVREAVQRANLAVYDLALARAELRGMSTTLTAVLLEKNELHAAHVGDCRLYLLRGGRLLQLSRDHTVSAARMRLGLLSKARARNHPGRARLTRGLGRGLIANIDQIRLRILEHDLLLVCSDGIHGLLDDDEIVALCQDASADGACRGLIESANRRGSPDNVSAAVARVVGPVPTNQEERSRFDLLSWARRR